jgi:hypothetical protein
MTYWVFIGAAIAGMFLGSAGWVDLAGVVPVFGFVREAVCAASREVERSSSESERRAKGMRAPK